MSFVENEGNFLQHCISDLLRKLLPLNMKQGVVVHYALEGKSRSGVCSPVTGRTQIDLILYHSNSSTIIGKISCTLAKV
jgi:hypothetical protein